ncbi:MAG: hormogonium polysaccharide biosynthesis protein HpsA, partial [Pseudanabaena sp.]
STDPTTVTIDSIGTTAPNPDNRKGDLQMRASAVYHYKTSTYAPSTPINYQTPIACVSSYYDPTNPVTALDVITQSTSGGRSNNGYTYPVVTTATDIASAGGFTFNSTGLFTVAPGGDDPSSLASLQAKLSYQANLMFPNGRLVNEPLRNALIKVAANQTLSLQDQSALDSTLCSLQILDGTLTRSTANFPNLAVKESAFLDGREVKALNQDESLTTATQRKDLYDLQIEQREPLEIRVTDLDMNILRGQTITGPTNNDANGLATDYLLPYSGVVYATRDDALQDLSYFPAGSPPTKMSDRKSLSSTDFVLDPTRRPNGIRLINGQRLWRGTGGAQPNYTAATRGEKGLILVSNDPVYVKGDFNLHTQEEFITALETDWSNFYTRTAANLNPDFAYRPEQALADNGGDEWRPATVIADGITVQSGSFQEGFRNLGDYDLRNNRNTSTIVNWANRSFTTKLNSQTVGLGSSALAERQDLPVIKRLSMGFLNNNFVTSSKWLRDATAADVGTGTTGTFPNFTNNGTVTTASNVVENLWPGLVNAPPSSITTHSYLSNGVTPVQRRVIFGEYGMEICRKVPASECTFSDWVKNRAGTTALPSRAGTAVTPTTAPRYIDPADERFPRRLSFLRYDDIYKDGNKALIMASSPCPTLANWWPMPIGVVNGNTAATATANAGFTYPQVMGDRTTPFNASSANSTTYGNVGCPAAQPIIRFDSNTDLLRTEGRRLYRLPQNPIAATDVVSLPTVPPTGGAESTGDFQHPPLRLGDNIPTDYPATPTALSTASDYVYGPPPVGEVNRSPIAANGDLPAPVFVSTPPDSNPVLTTTSTPPSPPLWEASPYRNVVRSIPPATGFGGLTTDDVSGNNTITPATAPPFNLTFSNNAVYRPITFRVDVDNTNTGNNNGTISPANPITVEISTEDPLLTTLPSAAATTTGKSQLARRGNYLGTGATGLLPQVKNSFSSSANFNPPFTPVNRIGDEETPLTSRGATSGVDYLSTIYRWNGTTWVPADYAATPSVAGATQVLKFP